MSGGFEAMRPELVGDAVAARAAIDPDEPEIVEHFWDHGAEALSAIVPAIVRIDAPGGLPR